MASSLPITTAYNLLLRVKVEEDKSVKIVEAYHVSEDAIRRHRSVKDGAIPPPPPIGATPPSPTTTIANEHKKETTDSEKERSILVLCATDESFLNQKWKEVLTGCGVAFNRENKVYYVGDQLTEVLPFRIKGSIETIMNGLDLTFDIILVEFCPYFAFEATGTDELIMKRLKKNGLFITPDYRGSTGALLFAIAPLNTINAGLLEKTTIRYKSSSGQKQFIINKKLGEPSGGGGGGQRIGGGDRSTSAAADTRRKKRRTH